MNCIFASNAQCVPSLVCGKCSHNTSLNTKKLNELAMYGYDKINDDKVLTGKQVYKYKKKFEKYLQKLMDKGIIVSWHYNGDYRITFNEWH